jgi:replicative DNA helicase
MLSSRQVGRKLSYKLKKTTSELYSGNKDKKIEDGDFNKIKEETEKLKQYPIYYVDVPGNVEEMRNTIIHFSKTIALNKWLIIILDHTLLTKGKAGDKEREILAELQYMFMEMKKYGKNTIIQLSQMNREIETVERLNNNFMHFPMRRDVFGGDFFGIKCNLLFLQSYVYIYIYKNEKERYVASNRIN